MTFAFFNSLPEDIAVIPAQAGLRRQDAEANIGEVDGPKGEPQDAASNPCCFSLEQKHQDQDGFRIAASQRPE